VTSDQRAGKGWGIPVTERMDIESNGVPAEPRLQVLVVEADQVAREWVREALQARYVMRFTDGVREALDAIMQSRPDLLVSEVDLLDGDGFQLCLQVRRRTELRELPILLLTTRSGTADKVRGFQAGADDYVVKPIDDQVLRARVRLLTRIKSIEPPTLLGEVS